MHAYRRRDRIILFDDVDINTQIEVEVSDQKIVKSLLICAANRESIEQLSREIRAGSAVTPVATGAIAGRWHSSLSRARFGRFCGER